MSRSHPPLPGHSFRGPTLLLFLLSVASGCGAEGEAPAPVVDGSGEPPSPAMERELGVEACYDAGYLCSGLSDRGEGRITRWSSQTREVRVLVPLPPLEDRRAAREIQDAAVLGIRAWDGTPFPLRVERGERGSADITVRWVETLNGRELGRADTEWSRSADGVTAMRVRDFVLVLRDPFRPDLLVEPRQMRLTAAHEMGHALGLPHSDSDRDVMYPTNTANTLSARDYSTMAALYRLENGAILGPDALSR